MSTDFPQNPASHNSSAQGVARQTLERMEMALTSAQIGTWVWNISASLIQWDRQMHALFGLVPGTFGGQLDDFMKFVVPEDRERVGRETKEKLETCTDYDGEFRVVWPSDHSVHHIRVRSKMYCDLSTKSTCMNGVAWDVTDRKNAEEDLASRRHLFQALMDNLPDNIYFKDKASRFLAVNHAMALWFGFDDPQDMIGKSDYELFTEAHAQAAMENEQRIMDTGTPMVGIEEEETWEDGHKTWVSTTKVPLRDPEGSIIGTFGLSRDITKRKWAEDQLARVAEELRKKNEMLEEDLKMARELQQAMLPQRYPRFVSPTDAGSIVKFYHYYTPSMAVSGDFFDVFKISDTMAAIFICDVMGHGVRAAMVAAMIRTLVGDLHASWTRPGDLLGQLNRNLRSALGHSEVPVFASAFYVTVDLRDGKLNYANAGHPHPLCMHHTGEVSHPHELNGIKPGPALGLFPGAEYESCTCDLRPHDVVLLFTDGLFEVEGAQGEFYDYRRLRSAVEERSNLPTKQLCHDLIEEVQQFSASKEFSDDVCLVAMEVDRLAAGVV